MPLFSISNQYLSAVEQTNFLTEKNLQELIERNLQTIFNFRFVASEFPTGAQHGGRIDTLALSEDDNPVIIEYKKVVSSELINQSLYYLAWIHDHKGDFERAVQRTLGNSVDVDWSDVRVICIAPSYRKYDLYAVQVMEANIKLWTYRLFDNKLLYLEPVIQEDAYSTESPAVGETNPIMVTAGKKAAITRATGSYTFEQHLDGKSDKIKELVLLVQEYILGLDPAIEEAPKKLYVAYKISQNIVCMEVQIQRVVLFLKLNPKELTALPRIARDVENIGHSGTGDVEFTLKSIEDFDLAKPYIEMAYHKVGG
jgi:predicted transport protein